MVIITGNTFPHKNVIKAFGFRWNAKNKAWVAQTASVATIDALAQLRGLIIDTDGSEPIDTRSHKQQYGRCEDAPCCGCCGISDYLSPEHYE
jgi:hypothetical protein